MSAARTTLQRRVLRSIAVVATLAIAASMTLVLFVLHDRVHDATDALLLQMAQQDSAEVTRERDEPVHVHDTLVSLPFTDSGPMHRYAAIARGCEVVAATDNVPVETLPEELCLPLGVGEHHHLTTAALTDHELRLVLFGAVGHDGEPLLYLTGVDHAQIDAALWATTRTAIPAGAAVVLLVILAAWAALRAVTRDLRSLADAGDALVRGTQDWRHAEATGFQAGPNASREVAALAASLDLLLRSIRQSFRTQSRFVATASHELRTPLTALVGELEVTLRRERTAAEYRQTLEDLSTDAARLVDLAEHLLQAARAETEAVPTHPNNIMELLTEAVQRNRSVLNEAHIAARIECAATLSANCHHLSMEQVLDNLIQNTARHADATRIALAARADGDQVLITVEDDGRGIPDALKPHLFRPFQRGRDAAHATDKPSGALQPAGHGLGLYIAAELMKRQAGDLALTSSKPTRWQLTLPRA